MPRWLRAMAVLSWLTAAVAVAFFFIGLADGTVSASNAALWLALLAAVAASLGAGHALGRRGRHALAAAALSATALPALVGLVAVLAMIVFQPRWN